MNCVKAIAAVLVLWSSAAWGATLMWSADSEPDLAGYRVYQCSQQPCTRTSGNASPLVTLGTVTSFNIGTPAITEYYFVTAYDLSNNESGESNLATFTPAGAPPPVVPPAIGASPMSLSFAATQGGTNPTTQTLSISNTGGGTLSWSVSHDATWLSHTPGTGTGTGTVTISVTTGTLTVGTYSGLVTLWPIGASSVTVPVRFTVVATAPVPPPVTPPQATSAAPQSPGGLHISAVR